MRTLDPKAAVDGEKEEFPDSWRKCRPGTPIPQIFVASVKQSVENDAPMYVQLRSILQIFIDKSNRACLPKGKQAHGYRGEGEGGELRSHGRSHESKQVRTIQKKEEFPGFM
jgi:hypothetical protein